MSTILNYEKWKMLKEQVSTENASADFIVASGATKVPMRDITLNKEQSYPLVDGSGPQDMHLYEITLGAAASKNFSVAKSGEKVTQDIIEFDGKRISDTGKIVIEWNAANLAKPIKVSGNGALVLARAAYFLSALKNKGSKVGVIILELGAAKRYASIWSVDSMGISKESLEAKQRGMSKAMAGVLLNSTDYPKFLALRLYGKSTEFKGNFDNNGAMWLSYKDPSSDKVVAVWPPQKSEKNDALSSFYGKYSITDLVVNGKASKPLKDASKVLVGMINTSIDNLAAYMPQFIKEKTTGLEDQYVNLLAKRSQDIIISSKEKNTVDALSQNAVATLTQKDEAGSSSGGAPEQKTKEFGSGES